jgi:hypothetical protein
MPATAQNDHIKKCLDGLSMNTSPEGTLAPRVQLTRQELQLAELARGSTNLAFQQLEASALPEEERSRTIATSVASSPRSVLVVTSKPPTIELNLGSNPANSGSALERCHFELQGALQREEEGFKMVKQLQRELKLQVAANGKLVEGGRAMEGEQELVRRLQEQAREKSVSEVHRKLRTQIEELRTQLEDTLAVGSPAPSFTREGAHANAAIAALHIRVQKAERQSKLDGARREELERLYADAKSEVGSIREDIESEIENSRFRESINSRFRASINSRFRESPNKCNRGSVTGSLRMETVCVALQAHIKGLEQQLCQSDGERTVLKELAEHGHRKYVELERELQLQMAENRTLARKVHVVDHSAETADKHRTQLLSAEESIQTRDSLIEALEAQVNGLEVEGEVSVVSVVSKQQVVAEQRRQMMGEERIKDLERELTKCGRTQDSARLVRELGTRQERGFGEQQESRLLDTLRTERNELTTQAKALARENELTTQAKALARENDKCRAELMLLRDLVVQIRHGIDIAASALERQLHLDNMTTSMKQVQQKQRDLVRTLDHLQRGLARAETTAMSVVESETARRKRSGASSRNGDDVKHGGKAEAASTKQAATTNVIFAVQAACSVELGVELGTTRRSVEFLDAADAKNVPAECALARYAKQDGETDVASRILSEMPLVPSKPELPAPSNTMSLSTRSYNLQPPPPASPPPTTQGQ